MRYKSSIFFSLVTITFLLNSSEELSKAILKSVGTSGFPLFQNLMKKLNERAPAARLSYAYPLLTIKHDGVLTDVNNLEQCGDWYKLKVDPTSDATTTVMRFESVHNIAVEGFDIDNNRYYGWEP